MEWPGVVHASGAIAGLLGLGLVMGFSPTLYGVALHVLTHSPRPRRPIAAMVVGLAIGATVLLAVFRTVDPQTWIAALRGRVEEFLVHRTVDLAAAAVFVVTGVVVLWLARRPPRPARPVRMRREDAAPMAGIGFANAVVGVSGLATMYVTGRVLTGLSDVVAWQAVAYLPFLAALGGPYLLIAWAWPRMPAVSTGVARAHAWVLAHDLRPLLGWALLAAGAVFAVLGVAAHPGEPGA